MDITEGVSLEPAFGKDAVAIMLATDDNYAPYASVMLQSIKENASKDRNYDIVVVGNLSDNNKRLLEGMKEKNIAVRAVDMRPLLKDIDLSIFSVTLHFSIETYYRFFIPRLFHQYEKVLYLDVDMVTLRDVAELFDTDTGDNWWVATKDISVNLGYTLGTWINKRFLPYLKETLKMGSVSDYFQAGVMVWNIRQCIKDKVSEQLVEQMRKIGTPMYADQCIMNSLANGKHIHWIPCNWNVLWLTEYWTCDGMEPEIYKTAMSYYNDPYIVHYCSDIKPWNEPHRLHADKFWQYARKTPFYEVMLLKALLKMASAKGIKENIDQEIIRCKRKVRQYRILQALTFGTVKSFQRGKRRYRDKIKQLSGHVTTSRRSTFHQKIKKFNRVAMRPLENFLRHIQGKTTKNAYAKPIESNHSVETVVNPPVNAQLYSFDIFDTLITRKTATPIGIFCIVQDVLRRDYSGNYPSDLVEDFLFYRRNAEYRARQKAPWGEITLDQIYETILETFQHEVTRDAIWKIRNIEIETELQWCVPIPENIQKIHALLDQGERVVLISDMYLPSTIIRQMLEACDERIAQCPLYVSCEVGVSKHCGELFNYVLKRENVRSEEWHHCGDNKHADYNVPRSMGISATLYEGTALNEIERSYFKEDVLFYQLYVGTSRLYRINHPNANDKQLIGASLVGPLLFPYIDSTLRDAKQRGIDRLYFLARDGQILLKIAQAINERQNLKLDLRYLYCARQVSLLASLFRVNENTLARLLIRDVRHSIEVISARLGLSPEEMFSFLPEDIKNEIQHIAMPYDHGVDSKIRRFLLSDEKIQERITQTAAQHREMLIVYLRQEGFFDQQSLGIVDMGWQGSIQNNLMKAVNGIVPDFTIHGYYFSVDAAKNGTSGQNYKHSTIPWESIAWRGCEMLAPLEVITAANHGTTSGYFEDMKGRIVPKTASGAYLNQWEITELQDAALWFCQDFLKTAKSIGNFGISPLSVVRILLETLARPSKWVANALGTAPFSTEQNDMFIREVAPPFSMLQAIQYHFFRSGKKKTDYTHWEEATLARSTKTVQRVFRICKTLARIKTRPIQQWIFKPLKRLSLKKINRAIFRPLEKLFKKTNRAVMRPLENLVRRIQGKPKKVLHSGNLKSDQLVETATDRQIRELREQVSHESAGKRAA